MEDEISCLSRGHYLILRTSQDFWWQIKLHWDGVINMNYIHGSSINWCFRGVDLALWDHSWCQSNIVQLRQTWNFWCHKWILSSALSNGYFQLSQFWYFIILPNVPKIVSISENMPALSRMSHRIPTIKAQLNFSTIIFIYGYIILLQ